MPRAHGQFPEGLGGKRIGRDEKPRHPRTAMRHHRNHEDEVRPLRAAGDATPQQQATRAVVGRKAVGFEGERRGLPAFVACRGECERTEGGRTQRDGGGAIVGHDDAMNRERRKQRESEQDRSDGGRAPQRNALRCARRPGTFVFARQATQTRLKTSVPFVPPNPNEFFSATSIFISRAVLAQ